MSLSTKLETEIPNRTHSLDTLVRFSGLLKLRAHLCSSSAQKVILKLDAYFMVEDIRSYIFTVNFFHVTANNYYVYCTLFAVTDCNILCQNKIRTNAPKINILKDKIGI